MIQFLFAAFIILVFLTIGIWYNRSNLTSIFPQYPPISNTTPSTITNNNQVFSSGNEITVTNPRPNQTITSPLQISGQAPGSWFFEAQAPVKLVDSEGKILATGQIKTQGDWQTTDLVPFSGKLTFSQPSISNGQLILEKDNPSGNPINDEQTSIQVRFR